MNKSAKIKNLHRLCLFAFACAVAHLFCSCGGGNIGAPILTPASAADFKDPTRVTIKGYSDHAMEPFISRDGQYLFFNNSNAASVNTNLHWAERIDNLTFQYKGEIGGAGVNTAALEGVPSMDRNHVFYFVSTRDYEKTLSTLYRGTFANGVVSGVELVPGISLMKPGMVNFDAEISADGNTLYFVDAKFDAKGNPLTADIVIAERRAGIGNGAGFARLASSASIMRQINTNALEYAPAISNSGLEIFFTRLEGNTPVIYKALRANTSLPFELPTKIQAITGFVEAPTLSPDEKALYYHKSDNGKSDGKFSIYRVTRP